MSESVLVALIAATGGIIVKSIIDGIRSWAKGRMNEAHQKQLSLDEEVTRRRAAEQALHAHRVALIKAGVPQDQMPRMPGDHDD